MNIDEEFNKLIVEPLDQQAKEIGENIHNYRVCGQCLNYVERKFYNEHMKSEHGFTIFDIGPINKE